MNEPSEPDTIAHLPVVDEYEPMPPDELESTLRRVYRLIRDCMTEPECGTMEGDTIQEGDHAE